MIRHIVTTAIGKAVRGGMRLRGGGSALPGLVVEKIDSGFIPRALQDLPYGVVVVSGTNGKTTTTKIVVELLEAAGLLGEVNQRGKLDADIAVLELDEAWAVKFVQQVQPRYSLLLNVMRDQLDRFGEIDTAAGFLEKIAAATTEHVVLNRDDPRVFRIHEKTSAAATYFGLTTDLLRLMPTDDSLKTGDAVANESVPAEVVLTAVAEQGAEFLIDGTSYKTEIALSGVYNLLNAAAALALVRAIVPEAPIPVLLGALSKVKPAFGRGETITYNGTSIDLLLVKNPSGFRLSLLSFGKRQRQTMIAINDNYADGRDMSWLWDVDFSVLEDVSVVSGVRAYDMALRLSYDEVAVGTVEQDLAKALDEFLTHEPTEPKQIFCSYTAMTTLRRLLSEKTDVEDIS